MALRWRPDTCGCVIDVDFETSLVSQAQLCPHHAHLDPLTAFAAVHGENLTKNRAYSAVLSVPALAVDVEGTLTLRPAFRFAWAFDADRALTVEVKGMPAAARVVLEQALARDLGSSHQVTIRG